MQPVTDVLPPQAAAPASPPQLKDIRKRLPLRVLSGADWQKWTTDGYVVVPNAVPGENVARLVDLLWRFDEKDPNDASTWYAPQRRAHVVPENNNIGMVEIYNHQFLWDNRMARRVYDAFVDVWDREDLWVSIDRANLNPPKRTAVQSSGFLHWDADTSQRPLPRSVQGVLSLTRQGGELGGFQCVPGLFRDFDKWVLTQPADRDPWHPDATGFEVVNVDLDPGDLLIFNSLLPHGVRANRSAASVRMAQYITMFPAWWSNTAFREERIRRWREIDHAHEPPFPGDPRNWEKQHNGGPAKLTHHGEKLLGLKPW